MSLKKKFFHYIIPSIAAMWVFSLYSMVAGIFVGQDEGPAALAAINIATPVTSMLFAVALLFATGTSVLVSIAMGKKDQQQANEIFTMNVVVVLALSILIWIASELFAEPLALFLGADETTLQDVVGYLKIIMAFSSCYMVSYTFEVLVKTDGFPALATIGVTFGGVVNIALCYLFIPVLHWGTRGAALATGLSQLATLVVFLFHFVGKRANVRFTRLRIKPRVLGRIVSLGVADCVTEFSVGIVALLFNRVLMHSALGVDGVSTYAVIAYVTQLVIMTYVGVNQGTQPLVSYEFGTGDRGRYLTVFGMAAKTIGVLSLAAFIGCILLAPQIVQAFIPQAENPQLFAASVSAFRTYSLSYLVAGFNIIMAGFLSAVEKPACALTISLARGLVVITACLYAMAALVGGTGVWFAAPLSEFLCLGLSLGIYLYQHRRIQSAVVHTF